MKQTKNEPIAIIGMGCRFPGDAEDPQSFWKMLCEGRDGVIEVPSERWDVRRFYDPNPAKPGKTYTKHGAYLRQPFDQMDALFFGISPREAESLDPQQRILLEVAWEALEDAGIPPDSLAGSQTGVFIGGFMVDHMATKTGVLNRDLLNAHGAISFTQTILSARIAYTLDLRGPCMTLDTACSSSLVALHQACQALRCSEAELALVGGVNIMYLPETPVAMCKSQFLAKDGRSKSFDARGDGYGRGEGAGIVVLKPLSAAQRDGDLVYAVIRGTGVNQDGRTDGITVPNDQAQADLISRVCATADIEARQINYFEAHGTGTAVGDPKECEALGRALGRKRDPEHACWVGSVKANIGHLEAAAGVAGIIKTALVLHHRQIPPIANLETPNPSIDFDALGIRLPHQLESLGDAPLPLAGVNSFGYGGTNAHTILQAVEEASSGRSSPSNQHQHYFLPLSARSEAALQALAGRYHTYLLAHSDLNLHHLCWSAAVRRTHHPVRLGVTGANRDSLLAQLELFASGKGAHLPNAKLSAGQAVKNPVFVFTGMGPQWWAMGRELLASEPVFRDMAERCDTIFRDLAGWSILEEMTRDEADSRIMETQITQPANFVLQASLDALWRSKGIVPAAIVGHSVGDVSAAYASGVLSLEDALKVSYHRSRLQKSVAGQGKMLAVSLSKIDAQVLMERHGADKVSFGAINSPTSLTLSGDAEVLEHIAADLEQQGIFNRFLRVELAYHSPVMDALRDEMLAALADLKPGLPKIPLYSTVTGERVESVLYDADYWYANIRQPVYFSEAMQALSRDGHSLFLELCPHPVLGNAIKESLAAVKGKGQVVSSLKRKEPEAELFYRALAELYTLGTIPHWETLYPQGGEFMRLPLYPWQRQTYWQESEISLLDRCGSQTDHPLLGHRQNIPGFVWEQPVNEQFLPWLQDHKIQDLVILPGAAYVEVGLIVLDLITKKKSIGSLEELSFERPLVINPLDEPVLHTRYDSLRRTYEIYSRSREGKFWTLHSQGHLSFVAPPNKKPLDLPHLRERCLETTDIKALYSRLDKRGLQYGQAFQGIQEIWRGSNELLVRVAMSCEMDAPHLMDHSIAPDGDLSENRYRLHPTQLDGVFQALISLLDDDNNTSFVPVSIGKVTVYQPLGLELWAHGQMTLRQEDRIEADLHLCDENGEVLAEISNLCCQAVSAMNANNKSNRRPQDWLYRVVWEELATPETAEVNAHWILFMDQTERMEKLATAMLKADMNITRVHAGNAFIQHDCGDFTLRRHCLEDMQSLFSGVTLDNNQAVIYGWGLDHDLNNDPVAELAAHDWLNCVQTMGASAKGDERRPYLFLLTENTQPLGNPPFNAAPATLIGLGRVVAAEYSMHTTLIDLPSDAWNESLLTQLLAELRSNDQVELEIALRPGKRYAYRLSTCQSDQLLGIDNTQAYGLYGSNAFVLEQGNDSYQWHETQRNHIEHNQLEIHVEYAVLPKGGFDVEGEMLIPVCGRVVNSEVHTYRPDSPVTGLVPLSQLGSYITLSASQLIAEPATTSSFFKRAFGGLKKPVTDRLNRAGSLLPFIKALYSLHKICHLEAGDRILIHPSGDGTNLAAVQVALALNCEVFATYTDPHKREALEASGAQHVISAERLDFVNEVMQRSNGIGVQMVLNTLTDEFAQKSLLTLAPFGHFVDFSDSFSDWSMIQGHFQNISLHTVNIEEMVAQRPEKVRDLIGEIKIAFDQQLFKPLEVPLFKVDQVEEAFQACTQQSVALEVGAAELVNVLPDKIGQRLIRDDGSYLITGGFGGFGLIVANWLAAQGAKSLVLVGRSGAASEDAQAAVKTLQAQGVNVFAAAADVGKEGDVKRLIAEVQANHPPLIGLFHTAGVLDDAMLNDLTPERLHTVMQPKAMGAWYLHKHSQELPMDNFVLFSSISSLVGKPGQGNYVAANAFLDQLAHYRRAQGMPGLSLNWGVLSEVGMAARQNVEERLERIGIGSFTGDEAMMMMNLAMHGEYPQLGLMNVDWQTWWKMNRSASAAHRYGALLGDLTSDQESPADIFRSELLALNEEEREAAVVTRMMQLTASVMRLPEDSIDSGTPLGNLGLDSLMAAELQGAIDIQLGVSLSVLDLMQGGSIEDLSIKIIDRMGLSI